MRLIDANLLVYAYVTSMPQHVRARAWLDATLTDIPPVGLAWPSLLAFIRLVSNPRVFERPAAIKEAWKQAESWLAHDTVWIPTSTERHAEVLGSLLGEPGLEPNHVPDAHLAALAVEHGLIVCTTDSDFQRFEGIRTENPLKYA